VVLLVDDDPDWRMLVRDALTQSDVAAHCPLDIHEVGDGEAALQYLFQLGRTSGNPLPSLIYLDCEMPRLDGVTMLSIIRRDPRLSRIPTVMLTGVADETEMRRASECGASAYIVKPPDVAELARVIAASAGYWLGLPGAPGPTNPMEQAA
jgi:CheY-like chemotaxis protein